MKLLDAKTLLKFKKSQTLHDVKSGDRPVLVKYFDPCGRYTLYVVEARPVGDDWELYGYCVSPLGEDCDEYGYQMLSELQAVRGRFGLGIERDIHFSGTINSAVRGEVGA